MNSIEQKIFKISHFIIINLRVSGIVHPIYFVKCSTIPIKLKFIKRKKRRRRSETV